MTVALPAAPASWRHCLTAVLIGLVIPAGAFGAAAVLAVAAAALIAGLSVPDRARHGRRVLLAALFHPLGLLCCLMLLAWLPSLIASPNRGETALTWVRVAGAIAGAAYLWSILDRNESLTRIARDSLILGTAVILTVSVVAILFFPEFVSLFRHSQKVSAWHRYKALASALACLIPLLAWLAWTLPGWRRIAAVRAIGPAPTFLLGPGPPAAGACPSRPPRAGRGGGRAGGAAGRGAAAGAGARAAAGAGAGAAGGAGTGTAAGGGAARIGAGAAA
jgi:hypothetical protein